MNIIILKFVTLTWKEKGNTMRKTFNAKDKKIDSIQFIEENCYNGKCVKINYKNGDVRKYFNFDILGY